MRVLYVFDGKMNGVGLDLVAYHQLRVLSQAGIRTHLVSRGRVDLPGIECQCEYYNASRLISWWPRTDYYGAFRRHISRVGSKVLRRGSFDLVLGWTRSAFHVWTAAAERQVPRLLNTGQGYAYPHPLENWPRERWPRITREEYLREYGLANLILLPSEMALANMAREGVPREKLISIGRGFDLERYFPARTPPDTFRLLFCGGVSQRKGAKQVLESWRLAKLPDAELWFVGAVDDDLEEWARENASRSVRFLGFQKDVASLMRQCHAQILLSTNDSMAKSLIEGAACGLATVGTADVGFSVMLGEAGYVVDRDDPHGVAQVLRRLYEDRAHCRQMGETARQFVVENLTWSHFESRFMEVLQRPVAGREGRVEATRMEAAMARV